MMRRRSSRQDPAAPDLLIAFFAGTLTMVLAVALLLHRGSGWDDVVAVALLLGLAAFVLLAIGRKLAEDDEHRA